MRRFDVDILRKLRLLASPAVYKKRIALKLLRSASSECRALADLFVPYSRSLGSYPPNWSSGTGASIHALYGLCRAMQPETVVEIGSARGYSTCALALACRQNGKGKVFAIDPHLRDIQWADREVDDTYEFLVSRLNDYELSPSWCQVIRATTAEASKDWQKPVDLLFIDGDHSYEGIKLDFETFRPWLGEHSLVIFHDSMWLRYGPPNPWDDPVERSPMGVPRFLEELKTGGYHLITLVKEAPGLTILSPNVGGPQFLPRSEERKLAHIGSEGTH